MSMTDEKATEHVEGLAQDERAEARQLRRELFDDELVDQLLAAADERGGAAGEHAGGACAGTGACGQVRPHSSIAHECY